MLPKLSSMALPLAGVLLCACAAVHAAEGPGIYTCVDAQGRKLTSDRPIVDCLSREQRQLNKDGSVKRVVPPTLTADERAENEAAERRAAQQRIAQADAVRRDRNLMSRYPDAAAHHRARELALDTVRAAIANTLVRQRELATERKPLLDEAEFYKGRQVPARLKQQIDANDAGIEAQKASAANQEAEMVRINKLYDAELQRLRQLWAGGAPGSLGPALEAHVPVAPASAPAASAAAPAAKPAARRSKG